MKLDFLIIWFDKILSYLQNLIAKMYSDKEMTDDKTKVAEPQPLEQPETTSKSHLLRKMLWNSSHERETYNTVVVNYQLNHKRQNTGALPKRREAWNGMMAAIKAQKLMETGTEEQDSTYNLQNLHQISNDQLEITKSTTSISNCGISNSRISICSQKPKCGSCQKINVEIFNLPLKKEDEIEDQTKSQSDIKCCKRCSSVVSKTDISCPRNSIKIEIFNIPSLQKVITLENKTPKITELLQQEPEIIVNSDEDNISKTEKNKSETFESEIVKVVQKFSEVGPNYCELFVISSKSTQNPEYLLDISTQTADYAKMEQKFLRTPSTSKLSTKFPTNFPLKKRQLELHRLRVQVEQKRLELLDLKLSRKRQEIEQENVLFEKRLQSKIFDYNQLNEDKISEI